MILSLDASAKATRRGRSGLRIKSPTGSVAFAALPPRLRDALLSLHSGVSSEDIPQRVGGGVEGLASWYYCLRQIDRIRAVVYDVRHRGKTLARSVVMSEHFRAGPDSISSGRWRLSRFAYLHRDRDHLVIESPASCAKVQLLSPDVMTLIGRLQTGVAEGELETAIPRRVAEDVVRLLAHAGMLVREGSRQLSGEDQELYGWHFADFLFHARSRAGRHGEPPRTFAYLGVREPLPAVKPPMSTTTIPLYSSGHNRRKSDSLSELLKRRRSVRSYGRRPISVEQVGEFLHRCARVERLIEPDGKRMLYQASRRPFPSAGGCYPLEIYLAVGRCSGLAAGLYHYDPLNHQLEVLPGGATHVRPLLHQAAIPGVHFGPQQVLFILAARFQRVAWKYNMSNYAAILKDVGVLFQTMYLVATDMNLAPCALGGGDSERFARAIGARFHEETSVGEFLLGSMPAGARGHREARTAGGATL